MKRRPLLCGATLAFALFGTAGIAAASPHQEGTRPADFVARPGNRGQGSRASIARGPSLRARMQLRRLARTARVRHELGVRVADATPVVAVIDGGAQPDHPDLRDGIARNEHEVAGDNQDNDGDTFVDNVFTDNLATHGGDTSKATAVDHGMHTGGIALGVSAPASSAERKGRVRLRPIGGLYEQGEDLLVRFERAVEQAIRLKAGGMNIVALSCSFGDSYPDPALQQRWHAAVARALRAGINTAAATANGNGSNMDTVPDFPSTARGATSVGAMNKGLTGVARFSSIGRVAVHLFAPGEGIISPLPGNRRGSMSGTSMATPDVAGTYAQIAGKNPQLTAEQRTQIVLSTVTKLATLDGKSSTGGMLNVAAALAATPEPTARGGRLARTWNRVRAAGLQRRLDRDDRRGNQAARE